MINNIICGYRYFIKLHYKQNANVIRIPIIILTIFNKIINIFIFYIYLDSCVSKMEGIIITYI